MSLRSKFGNEGCKRFGDDKESVRPLDVPRKRIPAAAETALMQEEIDTLNALVKNLRQQVAELTMKLSGTKNPPGDKKSSGPTIKIRATSGRGRPRLPDDERDRRRRAQKAAARKPKAHDGKTEGSG
jgi:hypothetical protein